MGEVTNPKLSSCAPAQLDLEHNLPMKRQLFPVGSSEDLLDIENRITQLQRTDRGGDTAVMKRVMKLAAKHGRITLPSGFGVRVSVTASI